MQLIRRRRWLSRREAAASVRTGTPPDPPGDGSVFHGRGAEHPIVGVPVRERRVGLADDDCPSGAVGP
jgi:hypothetical protein